MNGFYDMYKYQAVEVGVVATGLSYAIPNQPNLNNSVIQRIEVYTADFMPKSPNNFKAVATFADLQSCFLTLNVGTDQDIAKYAALLFNPVQYSTNAFVRYPVGIQNKIFSWDKCSVDFAAGPSGAVTVVLGVYYDDRPATMFKYGYIDSYMDPLTGKKVSRQI